MADPEPGRVFDYSVPAENVPARSVEVRENFRALAQSFLTTNDAFPENPREGQMRVFNDGGNYRRQMYDGGAWRTVLQNMQSGIAAPAKVIAAFTAAANPWVIDHNLGTRPLAQVLDLSWVKLRAFRDAPREVRFLGRLPTTALATSPVRTGIVLPASGTLLATRAFVETPISAGDFLVNFTLDGVALSPTGDIVIGPAGAAPPLARGVVVPGAAIAAGTFEAGDLLDVATVVTVPPPDGAIELYGEFDRTMALDEYKLTHINENRIQVDFAVGTAQTGYVVLVG